MRKNVVITGSTRGIGFGLAREFLARDHAVVISGRSQDSVDKAVEALAGDEDRVRGQPCDVSSYEQIEALWNVAQSHFGKVDIWINNAGLGNQMHMFWEQPRERIDTIIQTNLTGLMLASKVAMQGMIEQGGGQIYNMEGHGSDGRMQNGLTIYGTSKRAVRYFTEALIKEVADTPGHPVQIGALSPGIVITDLLMDGSAGYEDGERARRIFNILGDHVETVTPWLVERILANNQHGARIAWLTTPKIIWRFLRAPFSKRDLFAENPG